MERYDPRIPHFTADVQAYDAVAGSDPAASTQRVRVRGCTSRSSSKGDDVRDRAAGHVAARRELHGRRLRVQSDAEVNKVLDAVRGTRVELFPDLNPVARLMLVAATTRVMDSEIVGLFLGAGDPAQVDRRASPGSISFAWAADFVRTNFLCRSLLKREDRDPAWTGGGPTSLEISRLPAPCGTGYLSSSQDGVNVRVTRLDLTFRDGHIEVTGNFDADPENDLCWEVRGGTFAQKLFLDFQQRNTPASPPTIVPRLDPPPRPSITRWTSTISASPSRFSPECWCPLSAASWWAWSSCWLSRSRNR